MTGAALADLHSPGAANEGKTEAGLKPGELKMAAQLICDMTGPWKSDEYADKFSGPILALVSKKVDPSETTTVRTFEDAPSEAGANNVVDLTDFLAKSLARRKPASATGVGNRVARGSAKKPAAKVPNRRQA